MCIPLTQLEDKTNTMKEQETTGFVGVMVLTLENNSAVIW